jgi:ADP-ribosylglycohydrolase
MIGAITGDIVGSVYEFDNIKTKEFELFKNDCEFTDDSVLTVAVAEALLKCKPFDENVFKEILVDTFHKYGEMYPDVGYGGHYLYWVEHKNKEPYNSCGNGSAMRVSPVGLYAKTLDEALSLATITASVSHNHPEGLKGAQAIATCVFLCKQGKSKEEIKEYVENKTISYTDKTFEESSDVILSRSPILKCRNYSDKDSTLENIFALDIDTVGLPEGI